MRKAICNEDCQQIFELQGLDIEPIYDDIERVGFKCPHCGEKYTAFYTNNKIKKLQVEQQKLMEKSDPRDKTKTQQKTIMQQIETKKKQIKVEMDYLKQVIESEKD